MRIRSRSSAGAKGAERELKDLVSLPENGNKCGECGSAVPTWCSINLGVFLCGRCASVHRKVFSLRDDDAYSDVKSLSLDRWSERDLDDLSRSGGNKHNNELWNPKRVPFPFDGDEDKSAVEQFIRSKYIDGIFRSSPIEPEDYGISGNRRRTSSRSRSGSKVRPNLRPSRSYGSSGDVPSLGNRQARDYELSRYSRELRTLKEMGYDDIDHNAEALSHAHGDLNRAIDILERYNRRNGSNAGSAYNSRNSSRLNSRAASKTNLSTPDINPPLPKRRGNSSAPQPAVFDGTDESMVPNITGQQPQPVAFDGMTGQAVQQYFDPATGMIYVDQQEYQQQQQQLLLQQQQQQQLLMQQQMQQQQYQQPQVDQSNLMNLYQRPDLYTTPVEINQTGPQYQQLQQLQQQQQQQQQQQMLQMQMTQQSQLPPGQTQQMYQGYYMQ